MIYKNRIIDVQNNKNTFLFGVRGSGKTALLRQLFPSARYIDLLKESLYQSYLSDVGLFYENVSASKDNDLIIIDEIQRMPNLLNEVHRFIESSNRHFILTGSSALKIKRSKRVNLLGGRAGTKFLHPFIPNELGEDFNLDQALRYGLLPIVWSSADKGNALKDYVETYFKEEIKAEALVRNFPDFFRFSKVAGLCHGQIVNFSNISRDAQISKHFVRSFFSILEDTMMGFFLPAYEFKSRIKQRKGDKFYWIDPGVARSFKNNFGPVSAEEKGFLFEGLIAQILRAYKDYRNLCENIYYWSSLEAKQTEVDFLLEREKDFIAIEVKSKIQVSAKDYKGLKAIGELKKEVRKRIVVYLGEMIRRTEEGIDIWPFEFFCKNLEENFELKQVKQKQNKKFRQNEDSFRSIRKIGGTTESEVLNWSKNFLEEYRYSERFKQRKKTLIQKHPLLDLVSKQSAFGKVQAEHIISEIKKPLDTVKGDETYISSEVIGTFTIPFDREQGTFTLLTRFEEIQFLHILNNQENPLKKDQEDHFKKSLEKKIDQAFDHLYSRLNKNIFYRIAASIPGGEPKSNDNFFGENRSKDPLFLSGSRAFMERDEKKYSSFLIELACLEDNWSSFDVLLVHPKRFVEIDKDPGILKQRDDREEGEILSSSSVKIRNIGGRWIRVICSPDVSPNQLYGLNKDSWIIHYLSIPGNDLVDFVPLLKVKVDDSLDVAFILESHFAVECKEPRKNFVGILDDKPLASND